MKANLGHIIIKHIQKCANSIDIGTGILGHGHCWPENMSDVVKNNYNSPNKESC
jgi:hypothetical protein